MPRKHAKIDHPTIALFMQAHAKRGGGASIYGLVDPRDFTVRYIGKTNAPVARLLEHIETPHVNWGLRGWLAELESAGLIPEMVVLQLACRKTWQQAERAWIKLVRRLGYLFNIQDGGMTRGKRRKLEGKSHRRVAAQAEEPTWRPLVHEPPPAQLSREVERDNLGQPLCRRPAGTRQTRAQKRLAQVENTTWAKLHAPMPAASLAVAAPARLRRVITV